MAELTRSRLEGRVRVLTVALLSALELMNSDLGLNANSQLGTDIRRRFAERYADYDDMDDIEWGDIFQECVDISDWVEIPRDFEEIDEFPWEL